MAYARWVIHKCAEVYDLGMIPVVDMRDGTNQYININDMGKINVWEYYFKQPCGYTLDDIKNAYYIVYSSLDSNFPDEPFSDKIKQLVKEYISFSDKINNMAEDFIKKYKAGGKRIVGLKFRGSDYVTLRGYLHAKQPTSDEMVDFIKESLQKNNSNPDYLFLATEDKMIIETLKREFGEKIILTDIPRINHDDIWGQTEYFLSDKIKMGEDYALDIAILGKCDALICSGSQGTWLASVLNENKYDYIEMISLGMYK